MALSPNLLAALYKAKLKITSSRDQAMPSCKITLEIIKNIKNEIDVLKMNRRLSITDKIVYMSLFKTLALLLFDDVISKINLGYDTELTDDDFIGEDGIQPSDFNDMLDDKQFDGIRESFSKLIDGIGDADATRPGS